MIKNSSPESSLQALRLLAEEKLARQKKQVKDLSAEQLDQLLHELHTHQIELEMQNEELRMIQHQLLESRDRYVELYDFAPVGYVTLNDKGLLLECNMTATKMLGVDRAKLINQRLSSFILADDQDIYYQHIVSLKKYGQQFSSEFRLVGIDKTPFWVRLECSAKTCNDEKSVEFRCSLIDIDQTKHAFRLLRQSHDNLEHTVQQRTEELRESNKKLLIEIDEHKLAEQRFRAIFEQAAVGVAITDNKTGRLTLVNIKYCEIVKYSPTEIIHKTFQQLTHPEDLPQELNQLEKLLNNSIREFSMEKRLIRKDGSTVWVHLSVSPLWNTAEAPLSHMAIIRDITERKQLEQEIRQHQSELAHLDRLHLMGEMAAGIAHELNQPLTAIANYNTAVLKLMSKEVMHNENIKMALEGARDQALRAGEIIRHMRKLINKHSPDTTIADTNELIKQVAKFLKTFAIKDNIEIQLTLHPKLPLVLIDEIQIEQVMLNIMRNAFDAIREAGCSNRKVIISSEINAKGNVQINIADSGPGIEPDKLEKIFEGFMSTKERSGMGMGLAISKTIIERHGGGLWATSSPGNGAVFHFTLPQANS